MREFDSGRLGLIIQGLVVFFAFSTLTGRVYFLKYYDSLGVPTWDIRASAIDYSVISPDVTIFSIGYAIALVAFPLFARLDHSSNRRWRRFWTGLGLFGLSFGFSILLVSIEDVPELRFGRLGLLKLLTTMMGVAGGMYLASAGLVDPTEEHGGARRAQNLLRGIGMRRDAFIALGLFLIAAVLVWVSVDNAYRVAERDADLTLQNAPQGIVEFDDLSRLDCGKEVPVGPPSLCTFHVVLIGDKFVYLRPPDLETAQGSPRLYAIPAGDIAKIIYLHE